MKFKPKNLIYFQNGSIGDFLMAVFFLENIYLNDNSIKLNVIIPKNEKLLLQFLEKYPYINLILANRRTLKGIWGIISLSRFVFSKNLVITASTPGKLSFYIKIIAKKISFSPKSKLVGFDDGEKVNKLIYNKLLKYNTKILYSDFLKDLIRKLGFEVKKEIPELKYKKDENILRKLGLEKNKYIVFHTQGSSRGRSFSEKEIIDLIKKMIGISPDIKIILTGGSADKEILTVISLLFKKNVLIFVDSKMSELCTVLDNTKLFIGVDTGTTHIASFLKKNSLVISHRATTSNWLPYYNPNAKILYSVDDCSDNIYEGRKHLEDFRGGKLRCLGKVPIQVIERNLEKLII